MSKKKMLMRKFGSVAVVNNTFIGGVASVINTPALLAAKLKYYPSGSAFSENDIQNFTIVGDDIECRIGVDYSIGLYSFYNVSSDSITYYQEIEGFCKSIESSAFYQNATIKYIELIGCLALNMSIGAGFQTFADCVNLKYIYIPNCIVYGGTLSNDFLFARDYGLKIYAEPTMETINSGGVEGDLAYITNTLNGIVTYVTNFDKPNQTTDLAVNTVYATAIKLDLSVPSSTNAIDFYKVYIDGVFYQNTSTNEIIVAGLTNLQTYNFSVIAVDIFYNKSEMSNVVTQQINGVDPVFSDPSSIISYYKFENNVLDSVGTNNGTATDITYASGQVGNAAVFNGSTSRVVVNDNDSLSFGDGVNDLPFSVSFILNINQNTKRVFFLSKDDSTSTREWLVGVDENKLKFYIFNSDNTGRIQVETTEGVIPLNTNNIISITYDGSKNFNGVRIYINSIFVTLTNASTGIYTGMSNTSSKFIIGDSGFVSNSVLDGSQDEISFFNKELSQAEVIEIYNIHNAGLPLI